MDSLIKVTVDKLELKDLKIEKESPEPVVAELTKKKIEDTVALLKDIEKANGYRGIVHATGVPYAKVKDIHTAMQERIGALTAVDEPIELVVEPVELPKDVKPKEPTK